MTPSTASWISSQSPTGPHVRAAFEQDGRTVEVVDAPITVEQFDALNAIEALEEQVRTVATLLTAHLMAGEPPRACLAAGRTVYLVAHDAVTVEVEDEETEG